MALKGIRRFLGDRGSTAVAPDGSDEKAADAEAGAGSAQKLSTDPLAAGTTGEPVDPLIDVQRSVEFGSTSPEQLANLVPDATSDGGDGSDSLGEMSVGGADGTMTTLDGGTGAGGESSARSNRADDYEPPSWWNRRLNEFSPDIDVENDGVMDHVQDSDKDGLTNWAERWEHGTNPYEADSDGDGINDGVEVAGDTDPTKRDTDGDLLSDSFEQQTKTDPTNPDTDGDGTLDGYEDSDGDRWQDAVEQAAGTDPLDPFTGGSEKTDSGETRDEYFDRLAQERASLTDPDPVRSPGDRSSGDGPSDDSGSGGSADGPVYYLDMGERVQSKMDDSFLARWFLSHGDTEGEHVYRDPVTGELLSKEELPENAIIRTDNGDDTRSGAADSGASLTEDQRIKYEDFSESEDNTTGVTDDKADIWGWLGEQVDKRFGDGAEAAQKDDPADTGHAGSSEREPDLPVDGQGEGEGLVADADGDGIPDGIDPDVGVDSGFSKDVDGDGVPDAIDPDAMTIETDAPEVAGSKTDPTAMLTGERGSDPSGAGSAVGESPWGPAGTQPTPDDTNPVGKAVDPNDYAPARPGTGSATPDQAQPNGPDPTGTIAGHDPMQAMIGAPVGDVMGTGAPGTAGGTAGSSRADGSADPVGGDGDGSWIEGTADQVGGQHMDSWNVSTADGTTTYLRDADGNWYDTDKNPIPESSVDPDVVSAANADAANQVAQAEQDAADATDTGDDSGGDGTGGDGTETGGDGQGGSGSGDGGDSGGGAPNFGGGMDLDRGALLDSLGRTPAGTSGGTEMKAPAQPFENQSVREPTGPGPVAAAPAVSSKNTDGLESLDPHADSDGDGVPDTDEQQAGTDPENKADYVDSDGDGVPDYTENRDGTDPNDAADFVDADGDGQPDYLDEDGDGQPDASSGSSGDDPGGGDPDDTWEYEGSGVSTSGNALDPGFYGRADAIDATAGTGAPINGAQPQPIDPSGWEDAVETGTMVGEIITSDDLAQPVPDEGSGGEHLREQSGVDPNASSGMFGTGAIDPGPDHVDVQTQGPWQDTPTMPDVDGAHKDSESSTEAPVEMMELGIALEAERINQPDPMSLIVQPSGQTSPPGPPSDSDGGGDTEFGAGAGKDAGTGDAKTDPAKEDAGRTDPAKSTGEPAKTDGKAGADAAKTDPGSVGGSDPLADPLDSLADGSGIDPAKAAALGLDVEPDPIDLTEPVQRSVDPATEPDSVDLDMG